MNKELIAEEIKTLLDTEDSLDVIAQVLAERMAKTLPGVILSEVDGMVIGWDTCGGCMLHIRLCGCPTGPVRPHYLDSWPKEHPNYGVGASRSQTITVTVGASGKDVPTDVGSRPVTDLAARRAPTACSACGMPVSEETGDRNDDGSWTCYACQTANA